LIFTHYRIREVYSVYWQKVNDFINRQAYKETDRWRHSLTAEHNGNISKQTWRICISFFIFS